MTDAPSINFVYYLALIQAGRMSPAATFQMVSDAFDKGELTSDELRLLLDLPLAPVTNAPGGSA